MAWESSAWNLDFVRRDGSLPRHGKRTEHWAGRRKEGTGPGQFLAGVKAGGGDAAGPCPRPPRGLPASTLEAPALVSLSASVTSKKADHALLLLGGQWTIRLFLKEPGGPVEYGWDPE